MVINLLRATDRAFPNPLKHIPDPPRLLYWAGQDLVSVTNQPCVAIVGSRKVSPYGRVVTEQISTDLARLGITIVSGLAIGVDSIAHQAALAAGGKTIAVLPRGLDKVYPATHRNLARKIIDCGGALITEYPEGSNLQNFQFLARNRIISGLCLGVIVTEAAVHSGSLNTANFALEQGREVMAIPGNITSPMSVGTNNLIKLGATPIIDAQDVLDALKLSLESRPVLAAEDVNNEENTILTLIGQGTTESAALIMASGLDSNLFGQTMTMLELSGLVRSCPNGKWSL